MVAVQRRDLLMSLSPLAVLVGCGCKAPRSLAANARGELRTSEGFELEKGRPRFEVIAVRRDDSNHPRFCG